MVGKKKKEFKIFPLSEDFQNNAQEEEEEAYFLATPDKNKKFLYKYLLKLK